MIALYWGENIEKRKAAVTQQRAKLLEKRPDAEVFEIDADEFSVGRLEELSAGQGLFESKYIVFFYNILTNDEAREAVLQRLDKLAEADHVFVLVEDALDFHATKVKKLKAAAQIEKGFGEKEAEKFKPWPLSDAYGKRAKKAAWLELQKGLAAGEAAEALHGVLAWQTRLMLLAKVCDSAEEAGESGYPFKKASGFSKNYSKDELEKNFTRLVAMYHKGHRGEFTLPDALEQFLLEL